MASWDTQSAKTIKSSTLSTKHLCCSCSHSPAAPVSTALGRFALSTDSPCSDNSTFVSVHCMKSCTVFATAAVKLYREQRNTCPVQLGHCLCMLGIVLSLVCFFSFPPLAQLSVTACGSGGQGAHCHAAQDTDLEKGREQGQQHLSRAHPLEERGL